MFKYVGAGLPRVGKGQDVSRRRGLVVEEDAWDAADKG